MSRHVTAAFLVLCVVSASMAGYDADRQAAEKLSKSGKRAEALAAFLKLAEAAETDAQKTEAYGQAALLALRLGKPDQALEIAGKTPGEVSAKACQLRILTLARDWKALAAKFGDEDFDKWPKDMAGPAYAARGRARFEAALGLQRGKATQADALKQAEKAEVDLKKAIELLAEPNAKGIAINNLGDTYRLLLKDDARAIETYRLAYKTAFYKRCQAVVYVAAVLSSQQKHQEALAELETINMEQVKDAYWRVEMLSAYAQAYAAQGKKDEAIARYEDALKAPGLPPGSKTMIEKRIRALCGAAE